MGLGSIIKKVASVALPAAAAATGNPWLSAAASAGSGLLGNSMANDISSAAAAKSYEQTVEMMQNRHQWEVSDLKKAGLNPILSAGGTPSMGNSPMANVFDPVDATNKTANTGLATKRLQADLAAINANITNTMSQTELNKAATTSQRADAILKANNARVAKINGDIAATELPVAIATNANTAREAGNFVSKYIRPYSKTGANLLGDWTGAIGNIFRGSASTSTHYKGSN